MEAVVGTIALGAVVGVPIGWQVWKLVRRRRTRAEGTSLRVFAESRGWGYADTDPGMLAGFAGRLVESNERHGRHYLTGTHGSGRAFVAFDLELIRITTSRGVTVHTPSDRVVVAMRLPRESASFQLVPESFMTRGLARVLGADIDLEVERFNRAFTVTGRDRWFVVHALSPANMELLLANPDLAWTCHGTWLAIVTPGRLLPHTGSLDVRLDLLDQVIGAIPALAWDRPPGESLPGRHAR